MSWLRRVYLPTSDRRKQRPARRGPVERRGVALVMVLVLTTVLGAIAADLQNATSVNLQLAANARDQLQAHFHARSAIELELFFLRFQSLLKGTIGNFLPIPLFELSGVFVSSDSMKGLLKNDSGDDEDGDRPPPPPRDEDDEDGLSADHVFGDFQGSFWIEEVVDENRKININKNPATALIPAHILLAGLFDGQDHDALFETLTDTKDPLRARIEVMANITDWVDGNDTVDTVVAITGDRSTSGPSEDTRYNHLPYNATYKPKNGQMSSLAELRLVPGINDQFMKTFAPQLTVWTDDAGINMNTAEPILIRAIVRALSPGLYQLSDEEKLQKLLEEMTLLRALPPPLNKLNSARFLELIQKSGLRIDEAKYRQLEQQQILRFDDISSVYRVTAVGRVGDATSTITIIWRDDRGQGEIRYWRED